MLEATACREKSRPPMSYLRLATLDREEELELLSESPFPTTFAIPAAQVLVIGDDLSLPHVSTVSASALQRANSRSSQVPCVRDWRATR